MPAVVAVVAVVCLVAGCSSSSSGRSSSSAPGSGAGGSDVATDSGATTTGSGSDLAPDDGLTPKGGSLDRARTPAAVAPVPGFDGADFYAVPKPLPAGRPGAVIRTQTLDDGADGGHVVLRVMYHSIDADGHDRAVTGTISYPTAAAPKDGWPVVAWDHGTSGIAPPCAPSRASNAAPAVYGPEGVRVATDYLGLGPDGEIHPYLQRTTEARATIDLVRAARTIAAAHAGRRWVVVGHSQGGHAALSTGELAPSYAPELDLIGTVGIAPGAELTTKIPGENQLVPDIVTAIGMYGAKANDPSFPLDRFIAPDARGVESAMYGSCLPQIQDFLVSVVAKGGTILSVNPRDDPVGRPFLEANEVGLVRTRSPMLIVSGGQDAVVVPARTAALMRRLCAIGDTVQRIDLPGASHDTEPSAGAAQVDDWITARFAGKPAPTSC